MFNVFLMEYVCSFITNVNLPTLVGRGLAFNTPPPPERARGVIYFKSINLKSEMRNFICKCSHYCKTCMHYFHYEYSLLDKPVRRKQCVITSSPL